MPEIDAGFHVMAPAIYRQVVGELQDLVRLDQGRVGGIADGGEVLDGDVRKTVRSARARNARDSQRLLNIEAGVRARIYLRHIAAVERHLEIVQRARRQDVGVIDGGVMAGKGRGGEESRDELGGRAEDGIMRVMAKQSVLRGNVVIDPDDGLIGSRSSVEPPADPGADAGAPCR